MKVNVFFIKKMLILLSADYANLLLRIYVFEFYALHQREIFNEHSLLRSKSTEWVEPVLVLLFV